MNSYFAKAIGNVIKECYQADKVYVSHFLTLDEIEMVKHEMKYYPSLKADFLTGFQGGERAKAVIYPCDMALPSSKITILKLTYSQKYKEITHRHILGNLMALGIERNRIGDIIFVGGYTYLAIDDSLVPFLKQEFKTLNNLPLLIEEYHNPITVSDNGTPKKVFIASLRLDVVIAGCLNLSREKVSEIIESDAVKLNQVVIHKAFKDIKEGDLISIRHYGRIKIIDFSNRTKSGRFVLNVLLYK